MGPGRDVPTERFLQYPSLREFSEGTLEQSQKAAGIYNPQRSDFNSPVMGKIASKTDDLTSSIQQAKASGQSFDE